MGRCWEQIKHSVVYNNSHAVAVGTHAGFSCAEDGASHQCFEDISLIMAIPEIEIYCPGFAQECSILADKIIKNTINPMYIRLSHGLLEEYPADEWMSMDGYIKLENRKSTTVIISMGVTTQEAVKALRSGVSVIQDEKGCSAYVGEKEEHISFGGLYSIVTNLCISNKICVKILIQIE